MTLSKKFPDSQHTVHREKMKPKEPGRDIWHPGAQRFIKKDGVLTEFGREFFEKYHAQYRRKDGV